MSQDKNRFILIESKVEVHTHTTKKHILTKYNSQQILSMTNRTIPSILTLPTELFYRILDHLDNYTILCSMQNVCVRINTIIDTFPCYQVNFSFITHTLIFHFRNKIYFTPFC
jgi:hypothetical protein